MTAADLRLALATPLILIFWLPGLIYAPPALWELRGPLLLIGLVVLATTSSGADS